ncbi:MAG TPA: tail fiber domain-containing protein [Candidatus Binataceae bacterium]|nr:tail fiber domain-containing protein [Candidatus Binataceae bacterium]
MIALVSAGTAGAQNTNFGTGALPSASASDLYDSAFGFDALNSPTSGAFNTALGADALFSNTTGDDDTAAGVNALLNNTTGVDNTASGAGALASNTTGSGNTAAGVNALLNNTTGVDNTASGSLALQTSTTGNDDTASGFQALFSNTTGAKNTASGALTLGNNTTGSNNTASGDSALLTNFTGSNNTASGFEALFNNAAGNNNTAVGYNALLNSTGNHNIALGFNAGVNLTSGNKNVDIGNPGAAAESATIRIGKEGIQTATYVAGISGSLVTGEAVMVSNTGQLGVVLSSARYKRDIHDMGQSSDNLMKLRPVTFRYKADPAGTLQYGLVAEEVAKLYPELVTRGIDGRVQSVRYTVLTAMLLNELQKQAGENRKLAAAVAELKTNQDSQRVAFEHRFATLEREMASKAGGGQLASAFNR